MELICSSLVLVYCLTGGGLRALLFFINTPKRINKPLNALTL